MNIAEVQIPKIIFDVWMKKLKPNEFKVLLTIIYECEMQDKTEIALFTNQIMAMTGIKAFETIINAIAGLEEEKVIETVGRKPAKRLFSVNWAIIFYGKEAIP